MATIWKTQDELTGAVAISIMRATKQIQRPGWQRGTEYDEASLRRDIMTLQEERDKLRAELSSAKNQIASLTTVSDLAFEGCKIVIKYKRQLTGSIPTFSSIECELPELFKIISLQMTDVVLSEKAIQGTLLMKLFPNNTYQYSFADLQFIKLVLNQLKALGLIYSKWSKDKSDLFWGLTSKGEFERNKMILVRKTSQDHD